MPVLLALIAAALGWAVWKGKLRGEQLPPMVLGIIGVFFAVRGNILIGLATAGIALAWYRGLSWRLFGPRARQGDQQAIDSARFMLGVSRFDTAANIRDRHRKLITQNHPDTGGSADRARELNAARDLLLRDLAAKSL